MRTVILCASAVMIVLPLAMMKDVTDLSSISIASLCFYAVFTVYVSASVCVCVCVCMRACVRACVCACMHACVRACVSQHSQVVKASAY